MLRRGAACIGAAVAASVGAAAATSTATAAALATPAPSDDIGGVSVTRTKLKRGSSVHCGEIACDGAGAGRSATDAFHGCYQRCLAASKAAAAEAAGGTCVQEALEVQGMPPGLTPRFLSRNLEDGLRLGGRPARWRVVLARRRPDGRVDVYEAEVEGRLPAAAPADMLADANDFRKSISGYEKSSSAAWDAIFVPHGCDVSLRVERQRGSLPAAADAHRIAAGRYRASDAVAQLDYHRVAQLDSPHDVDPISKLADLGWTEQEPGDETD